MTITTLLSASCHPHRDSYYQGYVEGELMYMASPFAGNLFTLAVQRGQNVNKDQSLFTLDPEPEKSLLQQADNQYKQAQENLDNLRKGQRETILSGITAQINQTQAELQLAQVRVWRQQELYRKKAGSKDALDEADSAYKAKQQQLTQLQSNLAEAKLGSREDLIAAQESAVAAAKANLEQAHWAFQQKAMTAPTAAVVFDTYYKQGEWVALGKPVLSLLAPENIRLIFFIPESELSKIHLGQRITISCDNCKNNYIATINYISPQAEYMPPLVYSRDNNYKLVFRIKAIPDLKDAMFFHPGQPVYVDTGNQ